MAGDRRRPQLRPRTLRLGERGIQKQINLGTRESGPTVDYLEAFIALARQSGRCPARTFYFCML